MVLAEEKRILIDTYPEAKPFLFVLFILEKLYSPILIGRSVS